jgi:hypothetical protein
MSVAFHRNYFPCTLSLDLFEGLASDAGLLKPQSSIKYHPTRLQHLTVHQHLA